MRKVLPVNNTIGKVIIDVIAERKRQDNKWGEQNHIPVKWATILGEEYGELCKAILGGNSLNDIRIEAIHVSAVAIAIAECIDRAKEQLDKPNS
jgi:NTP pyrophosphatase (non-canonical NTP hydrolase)